VLIENWARPVGVGLPAFAPSTVNCTVPVIAGAPTWVVVTAAVKTKLVPRGAVEAEDDTPVAVG
jgi:hypothetical protein